MSSSKSNPERFRSATEFPRKLQGVESAEAEKLYLEMRDCLIFTNCSRSQLMRHNNGYRGKVTQLKTDVAKLQSSINALSLEKRDLVQSKQDAIAVYKNVLSGSVYSHGIAERFWAVLDKKPMTRIHL